MSESAVTTGAMLVGYETAKAWAECGYTPESRAYWSGMRDTLAVVLGITTEAPHVTGPDSDVAAITLLA